jgi:hypothetical protein
MASTTLIYTDISVIASAVSHPLLIQPYRCLKTPDAGIFLSALALSPTIARWIVRNFILRQLRCLRLLWCHMSAVPDTADAVSAVLYHRCFVSFFNVSVNSRWNSEKNSEWLRDVHLEFMKKIRGGASRAIVPLYRKYLVLIDSLRRLPTALGARHFWWLWCSAPAGHVAT